ncbi:MAG: glycoside hydrolase family 2 protein [Armatimonadota bacterium]
MYTNRTGVVDLNGEWKFIPDPMQRAKRQQWWAHERDPYELFPCWDMDGLWDIQVPGTWNCQFRELTWYEGHGLYAREFELPAIPDGMEAYLCFDGANYASEVWLNGVWVGKHECGYSPFQFRVTPLVQQQNRLMVYVENIRKDDRVPGMIFDWANDGGLIRPVKLILVPERHIEQFNVRTSMDGDDVVISIAAWFESRDRETPAAILVNIPALSLWGELEVTAGARALFTFILPGNRIELWEPGNPALYTIEVRCGDDLVCDEVGFREIRTEGRDILLNDKRIELWGVCTHAEFKEMGRTDTPELLDEFFAMMHDLGINYIRCAHYPYSEAFIRRADREGFLLWEEVPAYWQARINEPAVKALALQMMSETIDRDINRASVIIWSVSNECEWKNPEGDQGDNYHYGIECAQMIRQLDPSRLISAAEGNIIMNPKPWKPKDGDRLAYAHKDQHPWRISLPDAFFDAMDIIAINNYCGSYGQQPVEDLEEILQLWYDFNKPVVISEFGCSSCRGDDRDNMTVGGEKRHVEIVRRAYEVFLRTPWLSGASIWNFVDNRTPLHWEAFLPEGGHGPFGITDAQWRPKQVYYVVKEYCRRLLERANSRQADDAGSEIPPLVAGRN